MFKHLAVLLFRTAYLASDTIRYLLTSLILNVFQKTKYKKETHVTRAVLL